MDNDGLYERPGFLLRRSHQISVAIFERACANLSLTPAQYGVLAILAAQPKIDQTRLAKALAFDKVTVLRVLKGLQERGLCVREPVASGRRQMAVKLTPSGHALLEQARRPVQQAYDDLLSPLSDVEQAALVSLLKRLTQALEHEARSSFVPLKTG
jgi:DNA-binding MarR family transcriptional regulator